MKKILLVLLVLIVGYWLNNKIQNWMDSTFKPKGKVVRDFDDLDSSPSDSIDSKPLVKPTINNPDENTEQINPSENSTNNTTYDSNSLQQENQNGNQENQPPVEENTKVSLPDGNLVYKNEIPSGVLVSCQTQIQNCEPKDQQQYDDPSVNTFCITYANYCISSDSIQRTWADTDVFKPAQENLNDPNTIPQDQYNQQQYPNQLPIHPDYPQEPVPQYDPPPPPDFYEQQPPSDDQGYYPDQGFIGKIKTFV